MLGFFLRFRSSSTLHGDNARGQTAGGGGGARMATLRWNVISLTQMARVCAPAAAARALLGSNQTVAIYLFILNCSRDTISPHPHLKVILLTSLTSGCFTKVFFSFLFLFSRLLRTGLLLERVKCVDKESLMSLVQRCRRLNLCNRERMFEVPSFLTVVTGHLHF